MSTADLFAGLDLLSTAVVLLDHQLSIHHLNPAAENLFAVSARSSLKHPLTRLLGNTPILAEAVERAYDNNWGYTAYDIEFAGLHLDCTVTPTHSEEVRLLLEFRPIDRHLRSAREEQAAMQQQANRELIRNLAHEIKNPLGGIRGAAQLLEGELTRFNAHDLREYTQVIIKESDRLQGLMQRLLSSHRHMQPSPLNIHEVIEQVRFLVASEFPAIAIVRDFDISLPNLTGDREQLIQALLNVVRNAAQAITESDQAKPGEIILRTRALRQATIAKRRYPLALELQISDNGPGITAALRDKIFLPLVSGRAGGNGLGLALAQSFIQKHHGDIDSQSTADRTIFSIRLPLQAPTHTPSLIPAHERNLDH